MASICTCRDCGDRHPRRLPTPRPTREALIREAGRFLGADVGLPLPAKGEDPYAYRDRVRDQSGQKKGA